MSTSALDCLPDAEARAALVRCCGSSRWVETMLGQRPWTSANNLYATAERVWWELAPADWLEAFSHHPRLGDRDLLRERFAATREWSANEQAGTAAADEATLAALAAGNLLYERRFGHVFLLCASGKSAAAMLAALEARLGNEPTAELAIAAGEQAKILRLRLEKLVLELETLEADA